MLYNGVPVSCLNKWASLDPDIPTSRDIASIRISSFNDRDSKPRVCSTLGSSLLFIRAQGAKFHAPNSHTVPPIDPNDPANLEVHSEMFARLAHGHVHRATFRPKLLITRSCFPEVQDNESTGSSSVSCTVPYSCAILARSRPTVQAARFSPAGVRT